MEGITTSVTANELPRRLIAQLQTPSRATLNIWDI
jgi:hypothetical protein